jgi:hypothetical protein
VYACKVEDSIKLDAVRYPCIITSASGMAGGGRREAGGGRWEVGGGRREVGGGRREAGGGRREAGGGRREAGGYGTIFTPSCLIIATSLFSLASRGPPGGFQAPGTRGNALSSEVTSTVILAGEGSNTQPDVTVGPQ